MIYSRAAEYAIRACVPLAQLPTGEYALVRDLATQEEIPQAFLGKILQELARKGYLRSSKGPRGGFALRTPANQLRLLDIVEAIDGYTYQPQCTGGFPECSDKMPCPVHDTWVALHSHIVDYLGRNTIAHLVRAKERKLRAANGSGKRSRRAQPAA